MIDPDDLARAQQALEESDRVDAAQIDLAARDDTVVIQGKVASPEEASAAELVVARFAPEVDNQLRVDPGIREGVIEPADTERTVPAENEVLVGGTDMLAGTETTPTQDMAEALEENEPWEPPDEPHLAPTRAEERGDASPGDEQREDDPDADETSRADYAAADLSRAELDEAAEGAPVASLDPERVAPESRAEPDPVGVDALGETSGSERDAFEEHPHQADYQGATGEGTAGGGSIAGVPAPESGAIGADTQEADPVRRATGGTMTDSGTDRGPEADEDRPIREDFPDEGEP